MIDRVNIRRRIVLEAVARLREIDTGRGSETDAGRTIFLGQRKNLGPDDPPLALLIAPGDTTTTWQHRKSAFDWPIEIQVLVKAEVDDWYLLAEAALADVQAAMETEDQRLLGFPLLAGDVRILESETNGGLGITYTVQAAQHWGRP